MCVTLHGQGVGGPRGGGPAPGRQQQVVQRKVHQAQHAGGNGHGRIDGLQLHDEGALLHSQANQSTETPT